MSHSKSRTSRPLSRFGIAALLLLAFIVEALLVIGLFSGRISSKLLQPEITLIIGSYWLYASIKKWRARRAKGRQLSWYTQPGILFASAILLSFPTYIINLVTNFASPNGDLVAIILLVPSILLVFAAVFFLVKSLVNPFPE